MVKLSFTLPFLCALINYYKLNALFQILSLLLFAVDLRLLLLFFERAVSGAVFILCCMLFPASRSGYCLANIQIPPDSK